MYFCLSNTEYLEYTSHGVNNSVVFNLLTLSTSFIICELIHFIFDCPLPIYISNKKEAFYFVVGGDNIV